jgi:hypothetical protein
VCLHTKKMSLCFASRIYLTFNSLWTAYFTSSKKTETGCNSFLSFISQIRWFTTFTSAEINGLKFLSPGIFPRNQKFLRTTSLLFAISGNIVLSIFIRYLSATWQLKKRCTKLSELIGSGSLFISQNVHSARTVFTNLHTLELRPRVLFRNLNKNSLQQFERKLLFQSLHENFKIFSSGVSMLVKLKNVLTVLIPATVTRLFSSCCKILQNG